METTANNNIKMLLRDDATLILGHDINNIEGLESFSTAKLDVSGNIRTSQFLILNGYFVISIGLNIRLLLSILRFI